MLCKTLNSCRKSECCKPSENLYIADILTLKVAHLNFVEVESRYRHGFGEAACYDGLRLRAQSEYRKGRNCCNRDCDLKVLSHDG